MHHSEDIAQTILLDRERGALQLETEYRERLYSVAFALCHDAAEAEDLVFRTLERVIDRIETYEERDSFYDWMCVILQNIYRDSHRSKIVKGTIPVGAPVDMEAFVGPTDAAAIVEAVDADIARHALEKIPPQMREVLILHYFMDMPVKQIARILMISPGTVMSRLYHARRALAQRLGAKLKNPAVAMIAAGLLLFGAAAAVLAGKFVRPMEYEPTAIDQRPSADGQLNGEKTMNIKQKAATALAAATTYCVALVSSANAEVYTWTGSASDVWNKTDANWDKGVWVDGNIASFPSGVSAKDITLGADVTASGVRIDSGDWSLGGAHTLTLQVSGSGNVTISQTSSASLTLKNGVTVLAASSCENNINLLNIENATLATSSGKRFHNGWNGGSELAGGATINVRDGGTLSVYEFVPSPSQNAVNAGIYRINVATGGVFQLDHVLQQYNIDTTRYSTLYFDGGTLEGFPGASGKQFDRPSKTQIRLGLGGMRIAGDNHIYLRTEIASDTGVDGGIHLK